MSKLHLLLRNSSRLIENFVERVRLLTAVKSAPTATSAVPKLTGSTSGVFADSQFPPRNDLPSIMDLVKQINANHQTLVDRLTALESLVVQNNASNGGDQVARQAPPTESEIEAERLRLTSENIELRKQVDSLVRQLTALEVAVKGEDKVASLDLLPQRKVCSKPAQPSADIAEVKTESQAPTNQPAEPPKATPAPASNNNKENQKPQQEKKQKQPKQAKAEGGEPKAAKPAPAKVPAEPEKIDASRLDLRVGRILDVSKHPDADSLYVEQIECGEEKPRTVVSGLVKFVPIEQMQNRLVVILCNLKPAKMRGVLSEAMVMCASTPEKVEVLSPPEGSVPGDRVTFEKFPGTPDSQLNPKKKIWEQIAPDLSTNDALLATYKGDPFVVVGKGPVKAETLKNVVVK